MLLLHLFRAVHFHEEYRKLVFLSGHDPGPAVGKGSLSCRPGQLQRGWGAIPAIPSAPFILQHARTVRKREDLGDPPSVQAVSPHLPSDVIHRPHVEERGNVRHEARGVDNSEEKVRVVRDHGEDFLPLGAAQPLEVQVDERPVLEGRDHGGEIADGVRLDCKALRHFAGSRAGLLVLAEYQDPHFRCHSRL